MIKLKVIAIFVLYFINVREICFLSLREDWEFSAQTAKENVCA